MIMIYRTHIPIRYSIGIAIGIGISMGAQMDRIRITCVCIRVVRNRDNNDETSPL